MKLNKLVFPLVLALAAVMTTTACKHTSPSKVTVIPTHNAPTPMGDPIQPIPPTPPITPEAPPIVTDKPLGPGGGPTSDIDLTKYNQDPAALAAYTVHFKYDSAIVQDNEQANITSVAQALADQSLRLLIQGHCDERGTEEYNRSLGERRALALREALAKANIDPSHVKTISFGKDKPVDTAHTEEAWAKNRRGEFVLLRPKTPVQ